MFFDYISDDIYVYVLTNENSNSLMLKTKNRTPSFLIDKLMQRERRITIGQNLSDDRCLYSRALMSSWDQSNMAIGGWLVVGKTPFHCLYSQTSMSKYDGRSVQSVLILVLSSNIMATENDWL